MKIELEGRTPLDARSWLRVLVGVAVLLVGCALGIAAAILTDGVLPMEVVMPVFFFGSIAIGFRLSRRIGAARSLGRVELEAEQVILDGVAFHNDGLTEVEPAAPHRLHVRDGEGVTHALPRLVVPLRGVKVEALSSWQLEVADGRVVLVRLTPGGRYQPPQRTIIAPGKS
jgi:hypothetical protein